MELELSLRRYKPRWCDERLFAWLQWFRRLGTLYEDHVETFLGMDERLLVPQCHHEIDLGRAAGG